MSTRVHTEPRAFGKVMATVDEYVLPPDVTPDYVKVPRTDPKSPSAATLASKWKSYTPPPMPKWATD